MLKKLCILSAFLFAGVAMAAVEINKATEADLDGLPGIGPATTQLILKERKKSEFKDWADLKKRVKGMGDARVAKLSDAGLTVSGASYKDKATKTAAMSPAAVKPADKPAEKPTTKKPAETKPAASAVTAK